MPRPPRTALDPVEEIAWDDARNPEWFGIPREVREQPGAYDTDTAGGCG
jgi:hypothetical protein